MCVVHVRRVRMRVPQSAVLVEMRVRFAGRIRRAVRVLMMLVTDVRMRMGEQRVDMLMLVTFGEVQPDAGRHQCASNGELRGHRLA